MTQIAAVILAAGMSKRMGHPKQLMQLGGKPLFVHAVELAHRTGLSPTVVVVGPHQDKLAQHLQGLPVKLAANPSFESGMASSLSAGIRALQNESFAAAASVEAATSPDTATSRDTAASIEAAFVFLADQPFIPDFVIAELTHAYRQRRQEGIRIVRPRYANQAGHPVLFDAQVFPSLLGVTGDEGARSLIAREADRVAYVPFDNELWGMDIDTPEQWSTAQEVFEKGSP